MANRKTRKQTKQEEGMGRSRMRRLVRLALLGCAAAVLVYGVVDLYRFCSEGDLFVIRQVRIEGNHLLLEEEIFDVLEIPSRVHLWQVDPQRLEAQLLAISSIRSVDVHRVLPETLVIDLMERSPIADWEDPKTRKSYALDEEGVLLAETAEMNRRQRAAGETDTDRPEVLGLDVWGRLPGDRIESEGLEKVLSAFSVAAAREEPWVPTVRAFSHHGHDHGWVMRCGSEEREIRLGNRNYLERIGQIDPVWKMLMREKVQVAYIDLRFPEQGILIKPLNCGPDCWVGIAEKYPEPKRGTSGPV